ncbi:MAG: hypothetical protein ACI83W_002034 [Marinoscillum sp.]|jgi:hypothetical protein
MKFPINYTLILGLMILISCASNNDQNSIESLTTPNGFVSLKDSEISKEFSSNEYKKAGGIISLDSAKSKLARGIGRAQTNKENYGFVIGLDSLKEYIARIDSINSISPDTIQAVRIYLVTSYIKESTPPRKWKEYLDVMVVPVVSDGSNYNDLNDPGAPLLGGEFPGVLNNSMPCPQSCP